ncbi:MAG: hypothetical protein GX577_04300 [Leptolinea sp.]|nr:hypothetical protein [Leptolinea sp.]
MNRVLFTINEVKEMISRGYHMFLAGDETALQQLPRGHWIAGTTPYFMGEGGGLITKDKILVTGVPGYTVSVKNHIYDIDSISDVYQDIPANGFGFIMIPAFSEIHKSFALKAPNFPNFATKPLLGWISGVLLDDLGKSTPKVINGETGEYFTDKALMVAVELPPTKMADIGILNIFKQGDGDTITFDVDGFSVKEAKINGNVVNFAEYVFSNSIDTKLPLVADYSGASINISIQAVDAEKQEVTFYAPVFKDVRYRFAAPVDNYFRDFMSLVLEDDFEENLNISRENEKIILFSCNCILNFLYSNLEGLKTGQMVGPITFGEVAYQLVNQTLVYLTIYNQPG